jgi:hypothetical protein
MRPFSSPARPYPALSTQSFPSKNSPRAKATTWPIIPPYPPLTPVWLPPTPSSSPSSEVPKLTRSTLVVQPNYVNSKTWLQQKQTPSRSPPGSITLTLHRGGTPTKTFWAPDSAVFKSLWLFPPVKRSAKELGLVLWHAATQRLVKWLSTYPEEV